MPAQPVPGPSAQEPSAQEPPRGASPSGSPSPGEPPPGGPVARTRGGDPLLTEPPGPPPGSVAPIVPGADASGPAGTTRRLPTARPAGPPSIALPVLLVVVLFAGVAAVVLSARGDAGTPVAQTGPRATAAPTAPGAPPPASPSARRVGAPSAAAKPGASRSDDAFCRVAGDGLTRLGTDGFSALSKLATDAGDAAPEARQVLRSALDEGRRLSAVAPAELTEPLAALASAWSRVQAELERAGFSRTEIIAVALKYLADPTVALSWEALSRWTVHHCGVDLLDGRPAGT